MGEDCVIIRIGPIGGSEIWPEDPLFDDYMETCEAAGAALAGSIAVDGPSSVPCLDSEAASAAAEELEALGEATLTRAEAAQLAFGLLTAANKGQAYPLRYTDVDPGSEAAQAIAYLDSYGLLTLYFREGDELGGVFLDRGERAVRAGVPVEHGEHDAVPVGGEQVGDGPVVPPREAAPVQEHRRPRARAERVSDHLGPFDGDVARAAPQEAPASLGRRMGTRLFSSRAPHDTGGVREFSTLGLSARSSRHETLWNTGQRFARSAGRLSTSSRGDVQNRWSRRVHGRSSRPWRNSVGY